MPSSVRQVELCGPPAGPRAHEPPALPTIGRHSPDQSDAVAQDSVPFTLVARSVGQFDECVDWIGRVDRDLDREPTFIVSNHSRQTLIHLQCAGNGAYRKNV